MTFVDLCSKRLWGFWDVAMVTQFPIDFFVSTKIMAHLGSKRVSYVIIALRLEARVPTRERKDDIY